MKQTYKSSTPNTGVLNYEIAGPTLILEFKNPKHRYVYGPLAPGPRHVARMIRLARAGKGLSTYIAKYVHAYQAKLPLPEKLASAGSFPASGSNGEAKAAQERTARRSSGAPPADKTSRATRPRPEPA